ncbi:MAG: hypothetical protein ACLQB1_18450 [Streptosporangiaceae bacterium]
MLVGLGLVLGLAARRASSEAETAAEAEVWDDDGEAGGELDDPEGDTESDAAGEVDEVDVEADGAGDAGELLGSLLGLVVGAGDVEEGEGVGVGVGVGVGFGVGFGVGVGVGVGLGEDVLEAGSAWQLVSVFALALVEVPGLGEAAPGLSTAAWAVPASAPRVRRHPPTTLSATTRTCARRMRIALSPLLIRLTVCSSWVRRRLGDGWVSILISGGGLSYACSPTPDHGRAALAVQRPGRRM